MSLSKRIVWKYKEDGIIELMKSAYSLGNHTIVSNLPKSLRRKSNPMKSREGLHEYWESRSDSEELPFDDGNLPENYLDASERSEFLLDMMSRYTEKSDAILELGCNVGRNLHFLHKNGYRNLGSIEINAHALEILEEEFPKLNQDAELYNSPVENKISEFRDNEFDICFTMAVLEHIHPESEWIFQEMVRITSNYIILIEDEETISWRHEPRRYAELFTDIGCELIETIPGHEFPENIDLGPVFKAHVLLPQ